MGPESPRPCASPRFRRNAREQRKDLRGGNGFAFAKKWLELDPVEQSATHQCSIKEEGRDYAQVATQKTKRKMSRLSLEFTVKNFGGNIGSECPACEATSMAVAEMFVRRNAETQFDEWLRQ